MAAPQATGRFKEVGEKDITRLRGMTLFGIIKQMYHLCGVASMIVSPSGEKNDDYLNSKFRYLDIISPLFFSCTFYGIFRHFFCHIAVKS